MPRKSKISTRRAKATTPTKAVAGRVLKKRVNVKTIEPGEENSKIKCSEKQHLNGLRSFTVLLKRIKPASQSTLETLQAQCKPSETKQIHKGVNKELETRKNQEVRNSKRTAAENNINKLLENKTTPNSAQTKRCLSNKLVDKSVLHAKELNEIQNPFCSNKAQKPAYCEPPFEKIASIPMQNTLNQKEESAIVGATTSTLCTNKKLVVRLRKIPNIDKALHSSTKPMHPIQTKSCVVRLAKTANTDSVSSNIYLNVPAMDKNKRNNFRKLSLTKSFKALHDDNNNKETEISKTATKSNKEASTCGQKGERVIKQITKLSLKRPAMETNNDTKNEYKDLNFEPHLQSPITFNPVRNSTLLELDSTKDKQQETLKEVTNKITLSKERSSLQNLANKSDEIENLLNSLDDDEEEILLNSGRKNQTDFKMSEANGGKNEAALSNISQNINKTNKFFHHKEQNVTAKTKNLEETSKRRISKRCSVKRKRDNIYEFLSQSQTSDSDGVKHVDPTADIVKKLIQQGKVRVATNFKGKGKPKFKPGNRHKNKIRPTVGKEFKKLKNAKRIKKVTFVENANDNFEDHFDHDYLDNDVQLAQVGHDAEIQHQCISKNVNIHNNKNVANEQQGTFSRLARTVLINQAGRSNTQRKIQSELLEKVRNIISTPKNKKSLLPHNRLQTDLSPIAMPPRIMKEQASPWRVNESAYLPKTFNFSRSSGNLPSFSSDFIPSTPTKERPKRNLNVSPQTREKSSIKETHNPSAILSPLINGIENTQDQNLNSGEPSAISSFSSNDSNAENMPPPKATSNNNSENERIFNSKQFPNSRRVLQNRSPLKPINILEVVHLPPFKKPNKNTNPDDISAEQMEMFGFEEHFDKSNEENRNNKTSNAQPQNDHSKYVIKRPTAYMFGFEEFLSQTDSSSQENDELDRNETNNEHSQTLHEKLQSLHKLKPSEKDLQKIVKPPSKYTTKDTPIFDDVSARDWGMRQRGIKEMLCSTLLDLQPSTSKEALNRSNKNNIQNRKQPNFGKDVNASELFQDPEPETTFNESEAHRTYIRPHKRKRRLKEKDFVVLLESDESGGEDNLGEQEKHQQNRESDKNMEMTTKKKRQHKVSKDDIALNKFVKEFNELCKEVESHELIVERST